MSDRPHFPSTHWSLVYRAGGSIESSKDALAELLERYLPALRAYLTRTRRLPPEEAEDALHDFLLEKVVRDRLIRHADERRGKFRSFLLVVLSRYLVSRRRRLGREATQALLDVPELQAVEGGTPAPSLPFEMEWARTLLRQATEATEAECRESGRLDVWGLLKARVLDPSLTGGDPPAYETLVRELGLKSPAHASNLLVTGKRMFERHLRAAAGAYAADEAEVEAELDDLAKILSRGGAR